MRIKFIIIVMKYLGYICIGMKIIEDYIFVVCDLMLMNF